LSLQLSDALQQIAQEMLAILLSQLGGLPVVTYDNPSETGSDQAPTTKHLPKLTKKRQNDTSDKTTAFGSAAKALRRQNLNRSGNIRQVDG